MKKSILSVLFVVLSMLLASAQTFNGVLFDADLKSPISYAVIMLKTDTNGTVISQTITNELGKFKLDSKISKGYIKGTRK